MDLDPGVKSGTLTIISQVRRMWCEEISSLGRTREGPSDRTDRSPNVQGVVHCDLTLDEQGAL